MHQKMAVAVATMVAAGALLAGCAQQQQAAADSPPAAKAAPAMAMKAVPPDGASGADWLTYHGTWRDYDFSSLTQINSDNVKGLQVAWTHDPGRDTRGLQSMPLAQDGVLYYSGSYSRTYALDGATVDGQLIGLDQKTGKQVWDTKLINSEKLTVGFTGAPVFLPGKNLVVIGAQGGEWPYRGPIFGVDATTGKKKWTFFTVAPDAKSRATWGHNSWRTGGGGGWMPGTYDASTNTLWWGTANPAPLYDWSCKDWQHKGARPGDNLYTSSVVALDPDTGKLKFYHQE